jgi:hypothetical protein
MAADRALDRWYGDLEPGHRRLLTEYLRRRERDERDGTSDEARRAERYDEDRQPSDAAVSEAALPARSNRPSNPGRFEDVDSDIQVHRASPTIERDDRTAVDNQNHEHRSRARERSVGFRERERSVYHTASESETTSPSPPRRRGDRLGRGSGRSPVRDSRKRDDGRACSRRNRTPSNKGMKFNNFNFNAAHQIGRFDGQSEPLESFLAKFEGCASQLQWSDEEKQFHLRLCLAGPAAQILWDRPSTKKCSADDVIQLLRNRYGSLGQAERWRAELKSRRRKPGESLQDLYADVLKLFTLAYPKSDQILLATFLRDAFLDSLNDRQLYVKIIEREPGDIDEALQIAIRFEAYEKSYSTNENKSDADFVHVKHKYVRTTARSQVDELATSPLRSTVGDYSSLERKNDDKFVDLVKKLTELQSSVSKQNKEMEFQKLEITKLNAALTAAVGLERKDAADSTQNSSSNSAEGVSRPERATGKRDYANIICFECSRKGHVSRNCPNKRNRNDSDSTRMKQSRIRHDNCNENFVYMDAKLKKSGRKVAILLDTGCENNIIGEHLLTDMKLQPTTTKMIAANGSSIDVLGKTSVEFCIDETTVPIEFTVAKNIDEIIVGPQFLAANKCKWDFERHTILMRDREIKLKRYPERGLARRILVAHDVTIEPRKITDCVVDFPLKSLKSWESAWLIDCDKLPFDVAAARVVLNDNSSHAVLRIANASDGSVILKRGQCIGKGVPAQVISSQQRRTPGGGVNEACAEDVIDADMTSPAHGASVEDWAVRNNIAADSRSLPTAGAEGYTIDGLSQRESANSGAKVSVAEMNTCKDTDRAAADGTRGRPIERDVSHVQPLIDGLPTDLSAAQRESAANLIREFSHIFSKNDKDVGFTTLIQHRINTGSAEPIREKLRRHPIAHLPLIDQFVDELVENDIVEPCQSAWASNVVLARRKSAKNNSSLTKNDFRFCIDMRSVCHVTVPDPVHPPRVSTCLEAMSDAKYFSVFDSAAAYHAIELAAESDRDRTAFVTRRGAYRFKRMTFGLRNASATYTRLMHLVLGSMQFEMALCYVDDVVTWGSDFDQACDRLRWIFERFEYAGLKFKVSKSKILQKSIIFLSYRLSSKGIEPDPSRVEAIANWPVPNNLTEMRAFLGTMGYYRTSIENYAGIAQPLFSLMKKNVAFNWDQKQNDAFIELKRRLTTGPILAFPMDDCEYKVETDCSTHAAAAILYQKQHDVWRVISFASRVLNNAEANYCSSRLELLAVIFALKKFRHFLLGTRFTIVVDNSSLSYLMSSTMLLSMEARYLNFISEYDFVIERTPGAKHTAVDGLSRKPCCRDDVSQMCVKCRPRTRVVRRRPMRGGPRAGRSSGVTASQRQVDPTATASVNSDTEMTVQDTPGAADGLGDGSVSNCDLPPPQAPGDADAKNDDGEDVLTDDRLRAEQQADPNVRYIYDLLNAGRELQWADVNQSNSETRILFAQRQSLCVRDGLLYRQFVKPDGNVLYYQAVIPYALRRRYLGEIHGSKIAGHLGFMKSYHRLVQVAYWPQMARDLTLFIKTCAKCNGVRKEMHARHSPLRFANTTAVFEKVHVDLTGPHPKSRNGYVYILTAVCAFSKYLITVPLRNKSCFTVARELVRRVYLVFGPSHFLVHDGGAEFSNELAHSINALLSIKNVRVSPYRPAGNGIVERSHRLMNKLFATTVDRDPKSWCEMLPYIAFAYNSAKHSSTEFSPFYLMFAREANTPIDLVSDLNAERFEGTATQYVDLVRQRMRAAYDIVFKNMGAAFERAKRRYDERVKACQFNSGQRVWYFCPRRRKGQYYKWSLATTGPYTVMKKINDANYVIQLTPRHRSFVVNVDRLRPFTEFNSSKAVRNNVDGVQDSAAAPDGETATATAVPRPRRERKPPARLIEQ